MAIDKQIKVVAVESLNETVNEKEIPENGILSCRFILFTEMDDETLQMLYEQSPELVIEHRPDWVRIHYPNSVN